MEGGVVDISTTLQPFIESGVTQIKSFLLMVGPYAITVGLLVVGFKFVMKLITKYANRVG